VEGLTKKQWKERRDQTPAEQNRGDMRGKHTETLWEGGQVLSDFLHQMKEHNADVVCLSSGEKQNDGPPAAGAGRTSPRKP